jgi:ribonuclease J
MSSNPIPGNFNNVEELINKLSKAGVTIIQNTPKKRIHASGHATQTEQQLMFKLINPQYIIPIHGEFKMLRTLKINAQLAGINENNFIQVINGQKVKLINHVAVASDEFIDASEAYVDGNKINTDTTGILKYRNILSQDGIFSVTILIDRKLKKVLDLPVIFTRGSFYAKNSSSLITKIAYSIKENVESALARMPHVINNNEIRKITKNTTEYFVWKNKKKHPLVRTTIFDLPNTTHGN